MSLGPGERTEIRAVVVHYDTPALTSECVATLVAEGVNVTVIDNDSPVEAWEDLQRRCEPLPGVMLERLAANLGFGAGVNAGVRSLGPDFQGYVWVVNPDMRAEAGAAGLLSSALSSGELDIVSPAMYSGGDDRRTVYYVGGTLNLVRVEADHWDYGRPFVPGQGVVPCTFISGASFMLARSTWEMLGGMPDDLFLYWEDAALSYRARSSGMRTGVLRDARMWHKVGASTAARTGTSRATYYYTCRNRFLVSRAWGTSLGSLLAGRAAGPTYRWMVRPLLREPTDRLGRALAAVRGTASGVLLRSLLSRRRAGRGAY